MNSLNKVSDMVTTSAHPLQFDQAQAERIADDLVLLLAGYLPSGFNELMGKRRLDVIRQLDATVAEVLASCFGGDQERFVAAIANCTSKHLQAVVSYGNEVKRVQGLSCDSAPKDTWSGLVLLRERQDTGAPIGRNDRAALTLEGSAASRALPPPLPLDRDHANGPMGARA